MSDLNKQITAALLTLMNSLDCGSTLKTGRDVSRHLMLTTLEILIMSRWAMH